MNTSVDRTVIPLSHIGHSLCRPTINIRPSLRPGAKKLHEPRPMPVRSGVSDQGTGPPAKQGSVISVFVANF